MPFIVAGCCPLLGIDVGECDKYGLTEGRELGAPVVAVGIYDGITEREGLSDGMRLGADKTGGFLKSNPPADGISEGWPEILGPSVGNDDGNAVRDGLSECWLLGRVLEEGFCEGIEVGTADALGP